MLPVAHLKEQLVAQRRALFARVVRAEEDLRWLDTNLESEIEEEGQEENIARLLARLDDRGKAEIEAIDRALRRIGSGDYGRCVDCGRLIPQARLEALPATEDCVTCAQKRERPGR